MTGRTFICDTNPTGVCPSHPSVELHGYPCWACAEEYWRRYPIARAVLHQWGVGQASVPDRKALADARKADAAARAAYDGPHDTTVERAGRHGPSGRLWNALCTEGCGWSHYWLPSRAAAQEAADTHQTERTKP